MKRVLIILSAFAASCAWYLYNLTVPKEMFLQPLEQDVKLWDLVVSAGFLAARQPTMMTKMEYTFKASWDLARLVIFRILFPSTTVGSPTCLLTH